MVEAHFKMPGGMRGAADALRAGGLRAHCFMHAPARGTVTAMGASSARKMGAGGGSLGGRARARVGAGRASGARARPADTERACPQTAPSLPAWQ